MVSTEEIKHHFKKLILLGVCTHYIYLMVVANSYDRWLQGNYPDWYAPEQDETHLLASSLIEVSKPQSIRPSIDLLSIGSREREHLITAQQTSFGSHASARYFFNATEADDEDPFCSSELTADQAYAVADFCRSKLLSSSRSHFMQVMRNFFARKHWLRKKENPIGWLCAQRRPIHGLYKVLQNYERYSMDLPDKLILLDDDTYINLEQLQALHTELNPPEVTPLCLVRLPIHQLNFTFPFGGFGVIFNQTAIHKMMTPINCPRDTDICARVQESNIGEAGVFKDGMTLIELMQAVASNQPYRELAKGRWANGYCLHSDWSIGYWINYYNLTGKSQDSYFASVANDRLEPWLGSSIYRAAEGNCKNEGIKMCQPDSLVCHYMTAEDMANVSSATEGPAEK